MNALTLAEAAALWRGVLAHTTHTIEYVPPDTAWGRIAAADICAAHPYPPYRKSPFDGYALCLNGKERSYEVVATIGAGERYDEPVLPGQAVLLMTGCAVPRGCQAVVMQEAVRRRPVEAVDDPKAEQMSYFQMDGEDFRPRAYYGTSAVYRV